MQKRRVVQLLSFVLACFLGSPLLADAPPRAQEGYGLTKVWSIALTLSEKEYAAMQPALPGPPGAVPAAPMPGARSVERNAFGMNLPWASGQMTVNGQLVEKVSVRYAGDITYFVSAQKLKRPLSVRIVNPEEQKRIGAASLQLHAMPEWR